MKKLLKYLIVFIGVVFIFLNIYLIIKYLDNDSIYDHVYSHRGASGEEIEHTIKSYDLAVLYGSKYIEIDIVSSKDGNLYISHDLSAKRITGVDKTYKEMLDYEIENLRTKDNQNILSVEDVFKRYKDITFVIEIKDHDIDLEKLNKLVTKYNCDVIIQCNSKHILKKVKDIFANAVTLYLCYNIEDFDDAIDIMYIDIIAVSKEFMNQKNMDLVHTNGKKFCVWELNTTDDIKKAIDLGVDSYFTNYTRKAIELEKIYR